MVHKLKSENKVLKDLRKDIELAKQRLIKRAKRKGLWENFGRKEVLNLKDKYDYLTERKIQNEIDMFDDWAMNFSLEDLRSENHGS